MSIIRRAIEQSAQVMPSRGPDELRRSHHYLGQPVDRLDGAEKVTGAARFSAEYPVEGLVHGSIVCSTIAKGVIERIETAPAEQAPGVIAVVTHLNAPPMKVPAPLGSGGEPSAGSTSVKILNTDRVTWNGQPIAVVVAETEERAAHAASLVRVTYATEPAVTSFEAAIAQAKTPKDVLGESPEIVHGDPDEALRSGAHAVDLTFTTPPYNHNAIEPHAAIAVWTGDDRVTVYDTSQFTAGGASSLAQVFGLKTENVTLLAPFVGGGFGGKGTLWFYNQL